MTTNHPIIPPIELVRQWEAETAHTTKDEIWHVAVQAARWGADQELLACGNYLKQCAQREEEDVTEFYNYRRPKPPSLKEQAIAALNEIEDRMLGPTNQEKLIRRALEALND